jgi:fermentation-respiration switch protein FrsA (DUF1100 family)
MSRGWTIVLVGAGALLILLLAFCLHLYRLAIHRNRKWFMGDESSLPKAEAEAVKAMYEWFRSQPFEDVAIRSDDGLTLRAHYLEADEPTERAVILAHGYSGRGRDMACFAQFYHELGYRVLMPDNRGHGQSDGHYIGFGWHDRKDYVRWIEYLVKRIGERAQIVLHGVSMGGGAVLMTTGEPLPEQVKCVISDCAYSSVIGILKYHLKQMFRLPAFPLLPLTSLICKWKAGYFFGEASTLRQLRRATKPILLIHGEEDTFVPFSMAHEIYEAIPGEKERLTVPGAPHAMSFLVDPQGYKNAVIGFINRYAT